MENRQGADDKIGIDQPQSGSYGIKKSLQKFAFEKIMQQGVFLIGGINDHWLIVPDIASLLSRISRAFQL